MKKPGFLAASMSVVAASATAVSVSTTASSSSTFACGPKFKFPLQESNVSDSRDQEGEHSSPSRASASGNQFESRFDGLRFIETLVTAHRRCLEDLSPSILCSRSD